jgi:hypothetical protein
MTTVTATGEKTPDECHCTISLTPGTVTAHIYVNLIRGMALHDMKVVGESVILGRSGIRDPTLSIGTLPPQL